MIPMIEIVFRSVVVYLFIIFAIRLFGKKELSQLSIIDLVFILLISNSVQNAMVGNNSTLLGGIVAAISLFICNWILKNLFFKSKRIEEVVQGTPIMLVYHGKVMKKHLQQTGLSHEELEAAIREHGVKDITEVDLAVLEIDGNISILSQNFKRKSVRKRILHRMLNKNN